MVKSYKLIKYYPGSPKVGTLVEEEEELEGYIYKFNSGNDVQFIGGFSRFDKYQIENYPEFWEKQEDWDESLEEAKRRYPIGTKIMTFVTGRTFISNGIFKIVKTSTGIPIVATNIETGLAVRNDHGKWAEIIEKPEILTVPDNSYIIATSGGPTEYKICINKDDSNYIDLIYSEESIYKKHVNIREANKYFKEGYWKLKEKEAKEYEIATLKYNDDNVKCYLDSNGEYNYKKNLGSNKTSSSLENCLNNNWSIFKVRRVSDGETFKIGNIVQLETCNGNYWHVTNCIIKSIKEENNKLIFIIRQGKSESTYDQDISRWRKVKRKHLNDKTR